MRTLVHAASLLDRWSVDASGELAASIADRRARVLASIEATGDSIEQVGHLWRGLVAIADERRRAGDAQSTERGTVTGLHRSDGGVPKSAIAEVNVGVRGVDGDRQATRVHHGRPWQALCLWSAEAIERLAADGHPIGPGDAGENVTIRGLDWGSLRAGSILDVGTVQCQLWSPAEPCSKIGRWFSDGDVSRIHADRDSSLTRWYASVLTPGAVAVGDTVVLEP